MESGMLPGEETLLAAGKGTRDEARNDGWQVGGQTSAGVKCEDEDSAAWGSHVDGNCAL